MGPLLPQKRIKQINAAAKQMTQHCHSVRNEPNVEIKALCVRINQTRSECTNPLKPWAIRGSWDSENPLPTQTHFFGGIFEFSWRQSKQNQQRININGWELSKPCSVVRLSASTVFAPFSAAHFSKHCHVVLFPRMHFWFEMQCWEANEKAKGLGSANIRGFVNRYVISSGCEAINSIYHRAVVQKRSSWQLIQCDSPFSE